jgi:DNA-binding PadR family transcriptional regulator
MYAHAINPTGEGGCCGRGEVYDLRFLLRAMTGRGEGPGAGRGRHRHHGFGGSGPRGGLGGFPFGDFGPRGGPSWRGGRKARRGDIRTAALLLLAEEPRNGYEIMQEVERRSDGFWRPSPGSVYPALQQLEDEGLVRSEELDGRKVFRLTDAGSAHIEERGADSPAPWEQMSGDLSAPAVELGKIMREVAVAFTQVMRGSDAQLVEARKVLVGVRRDLYRILADGGEDVESR